MRFMGIKGDYEYYEDENGCVHKIKKLATERSPEFRDFPRGVAFKGVAHDFDDEFMGNFDYGNDKLMTGRKSKKTIKLNKKKGFRRNSYNDNDSPSLKNYF